MNVNYSLRWLFSWNRRSIPTMAKRRQLRTRLDLEHLEKRVTPTVQFSVGTETVDESAGTFSVPVAFVGAPIGPPTVSTFAPGFLAPSGLAFDANGNLYVADASTSTVSKVTPDGTVSTFASGFKKPFGLVFDAAGNLYVANLNGNTVSEVTPDGVVSTFASGFSDPTGLAFDTAGNLYVANDLGGTVSEVTPAGVVSTFASGFSVPTGLAFDAAGNLYVANDLGGTVSKVTPEGDVSLYADGFNDTEFLAFDAAGNLYVANFGTSTVSKVTPAGVVSTFASVLSPVGLAFDSAGNLCVANDHDGSVREVSDSVTVPFTLGGTAVAGVDYSDVTASPLNFGIGQTTATITGTLLSDPGAAQTLTLTLGTPTNSSLGDPSTNTLTITEPPASGTISGDVFRDFNLNGQQDDGESGLAGATVFLDLNANGVLDAGEPTAITDANGAYSFTVTAPGSYTVCEVSLGGNILSVPSNGSYALTLAAGGNLIDENFGDVLTSITVPLTLPPSTPFPSQGLANADYVEALYRAVLDRNADTGGLISWTSSLDNGQLTRLQVVQGIRNSPEHFGQEIDAFYETLLGRAADPLGRASWVQQLENGVREEQIAFDFLDSPEYVSKGDKFFVDAMYQSLLGRAFDPTGEANWLNALGDDSSGNPTHAATLTHAQVITDFLFSSESLDRLVEGYYEVFLQRQADPG
ncbi:MAG TPA: DUF4214 domain-containing protein, partial [Gemmataceae bacterium]|nr:DUF4214 domain-containing protein [Gemmataceae bacterium]